MDFYKEYVDAENLRSYEEFYELLISKNKEFNLTGIVDKDEYFIKHVVDSVFYKNIFKRSASVIEIGSGAGFPSVPLKTERRDLSFTLIESNEKKCGFLREVKEKFRFDDFTVVFGRAEELALKAEMREAFDYSVARAVAPLNILCELIMPFVKAGGYAVAYKGQNYREEVDRALSAVEKLGGVVEEIKEYSLPDGEGKRALVLIKKIRPTENGLPRRYAKIKKCPL